MQRARKLLLGSLSLFAPLSLGIASEILPLPRNADRGAISQADFEKGRYGARTSLLALRVEIPAETKGRPTGAATAAALADGDCWIVSQWLEWIDGELHLCTQWECRDGQTWVG